LATSDARQLIVDPAAAALRPSKPSDAFNERRPMQLTHESHDVPARRLHPSAWVLPSVGVALLLIFELDRWTGSAPVQHLYYLPIILASLRMGRRAGIVVSVAAIALYHLANLAHFTASYTDTDVLQTILFVVVGIVTTKLAEDARRLRQLAMTDDLTGLHNLRSFEARLAAMVHASRETRAPLAMLVLDVDRLKRMNDAHGHLAGAEAVRLVGQTLAACLPSNAVACRYGGDEFAVAIPDCGGVGAREFGEQVRDAVQAQAPVLAGVSFPAGTLSISVGLACLHDRYAWVFASSATDASIGEALFAAADKALYTAKNLGRNRVDELPFLRDARAALAKTN
jgi:diguanylate cyclase (GGDEF)-like protein